MAIYTRHITYCILRQLRYKSLLITRLVTGRIPRVQILRRQIFASLREYGTTDEAEFASPVAPAPPCLPLMKKEKKKRRRKNERQHERGDMVNESDGVR